MRIVTYLRFGLILLLGCAAGCGMPDYEQRMDAQRKRITEFDDANRTLEDPIDMTVAKKGDGKEESMWRFDYFLRLPKGYGKTPKDKTPYYEPFPFYRYAGTDENNNIFVAANVVADPKVKEKVAGEYHAVNFRLFIRAAIAEYYLKSTKTKLNVADRFKLQDRVIAAFSPYPDLAPKLKFDVTTYTDQKTQFDVYVHEAAGKQACIVVQHPAKAEALPKNIEACLSTLDLSSEAGTKRAQFKRGK